MMKMQISLSHVCLLLRIVMHVRRRHLLIGYEERPCLHGTSERMYLKYLQFTNFSMNANTPEQAFKKLLETKGFKTFTELNCVADDCALCIVPGPIG